MSNPDAVAAAALDYLSDGPSTPLEAVRESASAERDEAFIDAVEWLIRRFEDQPGTSPDTRIAKVDFVGHYVDIHGGLSGVSTLTNTQSIAISKVLTDLDRDHFEEDTVRVFFTEVNPQ